MRTHELVGKDGKSSPLKRAWGKTIGMGIVGVLAALVAVGAATGDGETWVVVVAGIVGLGALAAAFGGSAHVDCFACGKTLLDVMRFGYEPCLNCGVYGKMKGGRFRELDPNDASFTPDFALPVGDGLNLPSLCCECGKPSSRTQPLSILLVVGKNPNNVFSMGKKTTVEVAAPFCAEHKSGAKLDRISPKATTKDVGGYQEPVTVLKVRSYSFYRELLKRNPDRLKLLRLETYVR